MTSYPKQLQQQVDKWPLTYPDTVAQPDNKSMEMITILIIKNSKKNY